MSFPFFWQSFNTDGCCCRVAVPRLVFNFPGICVIVVSPCDEACSMKGKLCQRSRTPQTCLSPVWIHSHTPAEINSQFCSLLPNISPSVGQQVTPVSFCHPSCAPAEIWQEMKQGACIVIIQYTIYAVIVFYLYFILYCEM